MKGLRIQSFMDIDNVKLLAYASHAEDFRHRWLRPARVAVYEFFNIEACFAPDGHDKRFFVDIPGLYGLHLPLPQQIAAPVGDALRRPLLYLGYEVLELGKLLSLDGILALHDCLVSLVGPRFLDPPYFIDVRYSHVSDFNAFPHLFL